MIQKSAQKKSYLKRNSFSQVPYSPNPGLMRSSAIIRSPPMYPNRFKNIKFTYSSKCNLNSSEGSNNPNNRQLTRKKQLKNILPAEQKAQYQIRYFRSKSPQQIINTFQKNKITKQNGFMSSHQFKSSPLQKQYINVFRNIIFYQNTKNCHALAILMNQIMNSKQLFSETTRNIISSQLKQKDIATLALKQFFQARGFKVDVVNQSSLMSRVSLFLLATGLFLNWNRYTQTIPQATQGWKFDSIKTDQSLLEFENWFKGYIKKKKALNINIPNEKIQILAIQKSSIKVQYIICQDWDHQKIHPQKFLPNFNIFAEDFDLKKTKKPTSKAIRSNNIKNGFPSYYPPCTLQFCFDVDTWYGEKFVKFYDEYFAQGYHIANNNQQKIQRTRNDSRQNIKSQGQSAKIIDKFGKKFFSSSCQYLQGDCDHLFLNPTIQVTKYNNFKSCRQFSQTLIVSPHIETSIAKQDKKYVVKESNESKAEQKFSYRIAFHCWLHPGHVWINQNDNNFWLLKQEHVKTFGLAIIMDRDWQEQILKPGISQLYKQQFEYDQYCDKIKYSYLVIKRTIDKIMTKDYPIIDQEDQFIDFQVDQQKNTNGAPQYIPPPRR